jgi:hypothetical protein
MALSHPTAAVTKRLAVIGLAILSFAVASPLSAETDIQCKLLSKSGIPHASGSRMLTMGVDTPMFLVEPNLKDQEKYSIVKVVGDNANFPVTVSIHLASYDTKDGPPILFDSLAPNSSLLLLFEAAKSSNYFGSAQDNARSMAWGVDTGKQTYKSNSTLVFDFTESPTPIHYFGADLLDFEGGCDRPAYVAVYDRAGNLTKKVELPFKDKECGNGETREFGIAATEPIGRVAFFVGSASNNSGYRFRIAASDIWIASANGRKVQPLLASECSLADTPKQDDAR